MDYMICNVHMFVCVRIYTGVRHTDNETAQLHFDSGKLSHCVLMLRTGFEPVVHWISRRMNEIWL